VLPINGNSLHLLDFILKFEILPFALLVLICQFGVQTLQPLIRVGLGAREIVDAESQRPGFSFQTVQIDLRVRYLLLEQFLQFREEMFLGILGLILPTPKLCDPISNPRTDIDHQLRNLLQTTARLRK
jgi:hypothetical protein